jgi:hypothetical protein
MTSPAPLPGIADDPGLRLEKLGWARLERLLDERGCAVLPDLLDPPQARKLAGLYADPALFRSRIDMERYGCGRGEDQYFRYPLPPIVQDLRTRFYRHLVPVANRWHEAMGLASRFPPEHEAFIRRCHEAGQARPTPLLLRYGPDDFNCLHQDLYGEHVFPLQVTILLSKPDEDFVGGEFVMTRQVPRRQSQVRVAHLDQGDAIVFAVNSLPIPGRRGPVRATMRHGVSPVTAGQRHTLGIVFHDAL